VVWGFLKKSEAPLAAAIGAFGKIPKMGDFVRVGAVTSSPSFETWLESAMARGESRHQAAWPGIYGGGAIHAFVHKAQPIAKEAHVTVGLIRPSRDRVDRRFPLVVFAQVPDKLVAGSPHLIPLVIGDFLEAATAIAIDADAMTTSAELAARIAKLPPLTFDESAGRDYEAWTRGTRSESAWRVLYGEQGAESAFAAATASLREAIGPFRGKEYPATQLGIRLPLGVGGVAAAVFWLDVVRHVAQWKATIPSCFWSFDGTTGSILVQLGKTPPSSLCELWAPDAANEQMYDLTKPVARDGGSVRPPGRDAMTVFELLQELSA
jgi:type VI secretion system protein ImpM